METGQIIIAVVAALIGYVIGIWIEKKVSKPKTPPPLPSPVTSPASSRHGGFDESKTAKEIMREVAREEAQKQFGRLMFENPPIEAKQAGDEPVDGHDGGMYGIPHYERVTKGKWYAEITGTHRRFLGDLDRKNSNALCDVYKGFNTSGLAVKAAEEYLKARPVARLR